MRHAIAALALSAAPAAAMRFTPSELPDGRIVLHASGMILPGDFRQLVRFLDTMEKIRRTARLVIESPGGVITEAEKMAVTIHNVGLPVAVPEGATCASACVLLLVAAPQRAAGDGARIGVHRASYRGQENHFTQGANDGMALHFETYGVPRPIVEKMRATAADDVTWLDAADLKLLRVTRYEAAPKN